MPSAFPSVSGRPGAVGLAGICLGAMTGPDGAAFGNHLIPYVTKSTTEGEPNAPCLKLNQPGAWRFKWCVALGSQTIGVWAKQPKNTAPFPSLVVKKNASIGITSDLTATSGGGADWVFVGPLTVTASAAGVVWVELRNNCLAYDSCGITNPGAELSWAPCYFDRVTTS